MPSTPTSQLPPHAPQRGDEDVYDGPAPARRGDSRMAQRRRSGGILGALRSGRLPAALVALSAAVLLYAFLGSGDFVISQVTVEGVMQGDANEIATVARALDEPLFTIDASSAAARVAALPYVQSASVRTRFPGEVVVRVEERTPVIVWVTPGGAFRLDAAGRVLYAGDDPALPHVSAEVALQPGDELSAATVQAALAITRTLGTALQSLSVSLVDGLTGTLRDGRIVVFGSTERTPEKLAVYQATAGAGLEWERLDLREPDRPYYK